MALEILGNNFFYSSHIIIIFFMYTRLVFTQKRSINRLISSVYLCFIY